jgi:hypothetical protein
MATTIELALKAWDATHEIFWFDDDGIAKFEALVRADEREECAKVAESEPRVWDADAPDPQQRIAAKIRAR